MQSAIDVMIYSDKTVSKVKVGAFLMYPVHSLRLSFSIKLQ